MDKDARTDATKRRDELGRELATLENTIETMQNDIGQLKASPQPLNVFFRRRLQRMEQALLGLVEKQSEVRRAAIALEIALGIREPIKPMGPLRVKAPVLPAPPAEDQAG